MPHFDCVADWFADPELGLKVLPVSGLLIRAVDLDTLISCIKVVLPSDAKLMTYDGAPLQMTWPDDECLMIFGSKTWPIVPEGQQLPRLEPVFLGEAVGAPVPDLRIIHVPEGIECRLVANKRTHALTIPKDEETDDQCVVIVTPR